MAPLGPPRGPGPPSEAGAELARRTRRIDLLSGILTAGTLAVLEMGPAIAKKAYAAVDFEVALLTSCRSLGLLLTFFTVHFARHHARAPIVFGLKCAAALALVPVFLLRPHFALAFVGLCGLARVAWSMSIHLQVVVYRANLPDAVRGRTVGRIRQAQLLFTTSFALLLSVLLDWNLGVEGLVRVLGPCPVPAEHMVRWVVPAFGIVGFVGALFWRAMPEGEGPAGLPRERTGARTFAEFRRVLREDRRFRRWEIYFFVFGFANIMTIPLVQIHAVEELDASWFDLAMINVILVQGLTGLTMPWWGRRIDRHAPFALRGVLNAILAVDALVLAVAPSMGWVFAGRLCRGVSMGGGRLLWMLGSLHFARDPRDAAVYTGIHTTLTGIRWSLAPFAGVLLKNCFAGDSRPIFLLAGLVFLATGFAMFRDARRESAARTRGKP